MQHLYAKKRTWRGSAYEDEVGAVILLETLQYKILREISLFVEALTSLIQINIKIGLHPI